MTSATLPSTCFAHPTSPTTAICERCSRGICSTCAFESPAGSFCPDCMLAGPTTDQRRSAFHLGLVSVLCFALSFVLIGGTFVATALGLVDKSILGGLWGGATVGSLALTLTGITTGLIGREKARPSGSVLAIVGIIGSAVVLAMLVLLMIAGARMR